MKWCATCRANYRGSYLVHAGTEKHRRLARGKGDSWRALKRKKSYRVPPAWKGDDMARVRGYRRRRPLDGPARSVKVARYWRRHVQRWVHIPASAAELARRWVK